MKTKILIIANTYFQIITAINLRLNQLKNSTVDLILTDISNNTDELCSNIRKNNIFNNVIFVETKNTVYSSRIKKIYNIFNKNKSFNYNLEKYDILMFFNFDMFSLYCFNMLKNAEVIRFEEGYCSYLYNVLDPKLLKINRFVDKIQNNRNVEDYITGYYFYHPELIVFNCDYKILELNNLDRNNKKLLNNLNDIFQYKPFEIKEKFIFFEESFFCDNRQIDDLELILKIADYVGKDNFVVKIHPRNKINRFEKYGIKVLPTTNIPWEIIQMNNDFSNKVLMTISSGSVLASRLYFNDNINTYLLYNCTNKMSDMVDENYLKYINKLKEKIGANTFMIPTDKKNLFKILKKDLVNKND